MPDLPPPPPASAPGGRPAPAGPARRPTGWGAVTVVVAAVAVAVGLGLAIAGSVAASRAADDRDEARAALPGAREKRDTAVESRDAAADRATAAEATAAEAEGRGDLALAASDDLCDCDLRMSGIFDQMRAAFDAGDLSGANTAVDDLNAEALTAETALQTLRALDTAVQGVPAAFPG